MGSEQKTEGIDFYPVYTDDGHLHHLAVSCSDTEHDVDVDLQKEEFTFKGHTLTELDAELTLDALGGSLCACAQLYAWYSKEKERFMKAAKEAEAQKRQEKRKKKTA